MIDFLIGCGQRDSRGAMWQGTKIHYWDFINSLPVVDVLHEPRIENCIHFAVRLVVGVMLE